MAAGCDHSIITPSAAQAPGRLLPVAVLFVLIQISDSGAESTLQDQWLTRRKVRYLGELGEILGGVAVRDSGGRR